MKFLVEVKGKYSTITLLTESHAEAMNLYNEQKNSSQQISFRKLDEQQEKDFMNKINQDVFFASEE